MSCIDIVSTLKTNRFACCLEFRHVIVLTAYIDMLLIRQEYAYRRCGAEGLWVGRHINDTSPIGWTNYTPCFPEVVRNLLDKVYDDETEAQFKFQTATITRRIEIVGIALSIGALSVSIYIFSAFTALQNRRTIIHRHLFYALLMETTVRMWLYSQQGKPMRDIDALEENAKKGIEYLHNICEGTYILLEYSRLVVFAWMLIEGVFLNTLISASTLRNEIPIMYFYIGGWIAPGLIIAAWAIVVGQHYAQEPIYTCWYGYNYLSSYYIIQGPILAIVMINIIFLVTIMSVVIMKLRRTNNTELKKIKKAVRATLILVPLLGIVNIFNLIEYPVERSSTGFAIWAYLTHFFRAFQGVFIAVIYCFTNGEVIKVLKKAWERRSCCRRLEVRRVQQRREQRIFSISDNQEIIPMTTRPSSRPPSTNNLIFSEAGRSNPEVHRVAVHLPPEHARSSIEKDILRRHSSEMPIRGDQRQQNQIFRSSDYEIYYPARRISGPHTMPRARRQPYVRPGLVTHANRVGRLTVSSCL